MDNAADKVGVPALNPSTLGPLSASGKLDVRRIPQTGRGLHFSFHVGGKATKVRSGKGEFR